MVQARVRKDDVAKSVLSVVVGEAETLQFAKGQRGEVTDQQVIKVIQNVIKGNQEAIQQAEAHHATDSVPRLMMENKILEGYLPQMWERAQIENVLHGDNDTLEKVRQAANSGQATGIAMKFLKSQGSPVAGEDVAAVVKALRGE
jgi:uncharacterized protein YqeY